MSGSSIITRPVCRFSFSPCTPPPNGPCQPLDPETNFATAASYLRDAAQSAHLAILPEYHLTGWEPADPRFTRIAQQAHLYQAKYQELAAELKLNICTGTIVQTPSREKTVTGGASTETPVDGGGGGNDNDDATSPTLLNVSAFISDEGELLGTYIKTNIWIPERDYLTSSSTYHQRLTKSNKNLLHAGVAHDEPSTTPRTPHQVIPTALGKVGILICWDLAFPEAFRGLVRQGCELILLPTFWSAFDMSAAGRAINPHTERLFLESTLVARAYENTCTIVFCNAGGPKEDGYLGLSGVYAPLVGRVEGSFEDGEVGMRIVEIDLGMAQIAEDNYKIREDLNGEDWHYGYEKATR